MATSQSPVHTLTSSFVSGRMETAGWKQPLAAMLIILVCTASLLGGCSGTNGNTIEASGTIEGTDVDVGMEAAGRVTGVRVDEGTRVRIGDTLVTVDDTDYRIQLRQAVANLESFEAQYKLAREGSRKEDIVQAKAVYDAAEADYQRMKGLLASQTITQKQYDDVYARYVSAQQTYEKVRAGLRPEEITSARVRCDYATAQVDLLRKKVHDCVLCSPTIGIVTLRSIEPGELVGVGTNVLRITYMDRVNLMIYVNEQDLARVKLGQEAEVSVDGFPGKTFPGKVVYLAPSAEFTPKNVQTKEERTKLVFGVKIEVENPDGALKPGLPADARLRVG
jgi:HlyD family secretion protein